MSNELKTIKVNETPHKSVFVFLNASDGTAESAVQKVDISTLPGAPAKVRISKMSWAVSGMTVKVYFDHTTDDLVAVLSGDGELDLPLEDPASTGGTGDILFTTIGAVANSSYQIVMEIEAVNP
jgi:hypothetical protein